MADETNDLQRALDAIVAEARASVAAGRDPNADGLETRIAVAARRARDQGDDPAEAQAAALAQLERIVAVHRARARMAREPAAPVARAAPARRAFRSKPTITGTLEVKRAANKQGEWVEWRHDPAVTEWEVRFAERSDVRADYVERGEVKLPGHELAAELPPGDGQFRVSIVGRSRTGRIMRRALVTSLSRADWSAPWVRRATT